MLMHRRRSGKPTRYSGVFRNDSTTEEIRSVDKIVLTETLQGIVKTNGQTYKIVVNRGDNNSKSKVLYVF